MAKDGRGWYKEPGRHGLAAKGIPTGRKPDNFRESLRRMRRTNIKFKIYENPDDAPITDWNEVAYRVNRARRELSGYKEGKDYEVLATTFWNDEAVPTVVRWLKTGEIDDFSEGYVRARRPERRIVVLDEPMASEVAMLVPGRWEAIDSYTLGFYGE